MPENSDGRFVFITQEQRDVIEAILPDLFDVDRGLLVGVVAAFDAAPAVPAETIREAMDRALISSRPPRMGQSTTGLLTEAVLVALGAVTPTRDKPHADDHMSGPEWYPTENQRNNP